VTRLQAALLEAAYTSPARHSSFIRHQAEAQALHKQLQDSLSELLALEGMLPWVAELTAPDLTHAMVAANHQAIMHGDRAVDWNVQQLLLQPISLHASQLSTTIDAMVQHYAANGRLQQVQAFKQLSVLLQFAASRWCTELLLPRTLLAAAGAGSSAASGISLVLVDRLHAASCLVTVLRQLALQQKQAFAALDAAAAALSTSGSRKQGTAAPTTKGRSWFGLSNKKKRKAAKKAQKQPLGAADSAGAEATASSSAAAAQLSQLEAADAALQGVADGPDARFLQHYLDSACKQLNQLTSLLLQQCRNTATAADTTEETNKAAAVLSLTASLQGPLGVMLNGLQGLERAAELVQMCCGIFYATPCSVVAQLAAVEVLPVEELRQAITQACDTESSSSSSNSRPKLLLVQLPPEDGNAAAAAAVLLLPGQGGQLVAHLVCEVPAVGPTNQQLQPGVHQQAEQQHFQGLAVEHHIVHADDALPAAAIVRQLHLLLTPSLPSDGSGLVYSTAAAAAKDAKAGSQQAPKELSEQLSRCWQQLQQHSAPHLEDTFTLRIQQAQKQLSGLQGLLADAVDALQRPDQHREVAAEERAEISAALRSAQQLLPSHYELNQWADEVEALAQQLRHEHFSVRTLAAGHALLLQLNALSGQHRGHVELARLQDSVQQQLGCLDTYVDYVRLVSQLRRLVKFLNSWTQQQVRTALHTDSLDVLYSTAPTVAAFVMELTEDVLDSFECSATSIRLVQQHSEQYLQQNDQDLLRLLRQLGIPEPELQNQGYTRGLLQGSGTLLTKPVQVPDSVTAGVGDPQAARQLQLDNTAMRTQQSMLRLVAVEARLQQLLTEAQATSHSLMLVSCL